jgi:hypothetical protein
MLAPATTLTVSGERNNYVFIPTKWDVNKEGVATDLPKILDAKEPVVGGFALDGNYTVVIVDEGVDLYVNNKTEFNRQLRIQEGKILQVIAIKDT